MHRIDEDGNVDGQFTEGDPALGQQATRVGADWLNAVQEEICNLLEANDVELNKEANNQLANLFASVFAKVLELSLLGGPEQGIALRRLVAFGGDFDAPAIVGHHGANRGPGVEGRSTGSDPGVIGDGGHTEDVHTGKGIGVLGKGGVDQHGVVGEAGHEDQGTTFGVYGKGRLGVVGDADVSVGTGAGVSGKGANNADGVWGKTTGTGFGVLAESEGDGAPLRVVPRSQPAPARGAVYYDDGANVLRYYNGTSWVTLS